MDWKTENLDLQRRVEMLERISNAQPVDAGGGGSAPITRPAGVLASSTIVGNLKGCPYSTDILTELADEWDPEGDLNAQAFEDGVGVVEIYNDLSRVLIINDPSSAEIPTDLPVNTPVSVRVGEAVTLPVAGSDPEVLLTLYPVRLL